VQADADEVGDDHHAVARQAVRPDPADQQEADQREDVRREHETEVGGRPCLVDDEQRQRDHNEPIADLAGRLPQPEVAEVRVTKNACQAG
jgi:hypothetical protein